MRNVLIHGYDQVELDVVWKTATQDIPRVWRILQDFPPRIAPDQEDDRERGQ